MSQLTHENAAAGHTLAHVGTLLARAETLCRDIAGIDLGEMPLYVVGQWQLPAHLGGNSICDGFTSPNLDLCLRPAIGARWRGRGPCMVVRGVETVGAMDAHDAEQAFLSVAIHELAHIVARYPLLSDQSESDHAAIAAQADRLAQQVAAPRPIETRLIPFFGHGARFIRTALHLCFRAALVGTPMSPTAVFNGEGYCLSHVNRYRTALGDEPNRMVADSFREILEQPYPPEFWQIWTTDVAQWLSVSSPELER